MSLTALAFALVFGSTMLLALFRNPLYGLYAYTAVFYLHPPDRWWGADLPDLRWSLVAAIVTLIATIRLPADPERPAWTSYGAARILLMLTAWVWVQNLWALSAEEHLDLSILFTKYVLLFYLMYRLLDNEEKIRNLMLVHVAGCLFLGWLVLMAPEGGRLEGVGGPGIDESNALGMQLATGAIVAGVLLVWGKPVVRLLALASGPLILNGIIQTGSRGAFLAMVCGGLALIYLSPKGFRKYWYAFGIIALVALLRLAPEHYWERMDTIFDPTRQEADVDQSTETRFVLLNAQWDMFLEYPAGTGHRGTAVLSPRYLGVEHLTRSHPDDFGARSSHNTLMTALTEQGIPGIILYLGLLLWIFRTCRNIKAKDAPGDPELGLYMAAAGASLMVVITAGMFTDYYKAEVFLWYTSILAALSALSQKSAREREPVASEHGAGAVLPLRY